MRISRVRIENYKCFQSFELDLTAGVNILVGNNEAGKSTILEAIHLALSGMLGSRYLRNELSQYLFNNVAVDKYINSLRNPPILPLPSILIEVYLTEEHTLFEGNANSSKSKATGFSVKIRFDEKFNAEYQALIAEKSLNSIPIEYYEISWTTFARESISPRHIPLKSALIDSSVHRNQNGSDIYIARIIQDYLEMEDVVGISQAYRKMKEAFRTDPTVSAVNKKVKSAAKISTKEISLSAELPCKCDWEDSLITCVQNVPFHNIGKGEQCIIKTRLALSHRKAKAASILLLEEPENHLSHANLNMLLKHIKTDNPDKQIIVTTHSSFVANKLGLDALILLNDGMAKRFNTINADVKRFFEKVSGYDTLRLILAKKAILVEGDSDELVIQKAYMNQYGGHLPIEDGIDVISVGTSFLRFLEIAKQIKKNVVIVTDNDGDVNALKKKYNDYLGVNAKPYIKICFDPVEDSGPDIEDQPFNYNTLEPKLAKSNSLTSMNSVLKTTYSSVEQLYVHMRRNKTECALLIFETDMNLNFPDYIMDAIK